MSDLSEFLLARIADDEAWAESSSGHPDAGAFARDNYGILWVDPARVLAECEAKRRIVQTVEAADDGQAHPMTLNLGDDVLRLLALPYAEHPDYRPAWRP